MTKSLKVGVVLAALALVLAGCGPVPPAASTEGPVRITLFVGFGTGTDPAQVELHQQLAKEFNESHPDIHIEFVTADDSEHVTKYSTLVAGNMTPDIAMPIGVQGIAEFYDEWLDLSPYLKRDHYDTSDYYGPALEIQQYPGRTVGLPLGVYPSVVYYNTDLFDKAGLAYPPATFGDPTWTYQKQMDLARKLTVDKAGKTADQKDFDPKNVVQYGWAGWDQAPLRILIQKFGGKVTGMSDDDRTAQMNTPAWKAALQFVYDSVNTWHVRPTTSSAANNASFGGEDPMSSNKIGMFECFSWMQYGYPNWSANFHWDVAAIPAGPGGVVAQANADTMTISKHSQHPDQAWTVLKWLLEPAQMSRLTLSYGCIPARKSLAGQWLARQKADYPAVHWQVFLDSIGYLDKPNNEVWVPAYKKVWDAMYKALDAVTVGGKVSVDQVAETLNDEVQKALDQYWTDKAIQ